MSHVSSNLRSGAMLGETYLMLSMLDATDADLLLPDVQLWRYVQLPTAYMAENWPIQHAALSDDGRHVVIAGERGIAMCNLLATKWKLFGNLQHEKEFACCGGVAWFRDVAVLGCRDMRTGAFQLRAFSRKQNLDVANALLVYELPRAPLYVAVAGRHLLVYLENNVVHEYIVEAACNADNDGTRCAHMCLATDHDVVLVQ